MDMCRKKIRETRYRKVWSITKINFQRWKYDQRIWIVFGFIGVWVMNAIRLYTAYGLEAGKSCTTCLLPMLFEASHISVGMMKILLYLGCLFLLCDAPFMYRISPYMILRSRRTCWWQGECLYILMSTFLYLTFITLISSIMVLPIAVFDDSWGTIFREFSPADLEIMAKYTFKMETPYETISVLYPSGAQLYTFLTVWASFFVLGLLQYCVNLITKSQFWGFAIAAVFVFLDPILNLAAISPLFKWAQMLSPVCWVSTNSLHIVDNGKYLTIPYIVSMFFLLIVLLLVIIHKLSKRVMIEVHVDGEV